jgi:ribosome-associated toxin RatA of RatAB toxin-antitoxin module
VSTVSGESIVEVAAPLRTCWNLLLEVESYPHWYDTLDAVAVERRDDSGRPSVAFVRSDVGARLGSIEFRVALAYVEPTEVSARQVGEGSFVRDLAYDWRLEALGPDRTRVTYTLSVASAGMRAAAAFSTAAALVRRDLIDGFAHALKARAEAQ